LQGTRPKPFSSGYLTQFGGRAGQLPFGSPDRGSLGAPFDVYLSEIDVFQPDLLIVLNENRGILTDAGVEGAPDFVVEILSPKTRHLDLVQKKRIYARMGIKELWIIDPDQKEVTIYRFDQDPTNPVAKLSGEENLSSPLLPGLNIAFQEVFRRG
jgi:Uma2 family endonuclease